MNRRLISLCHTGIAVVVALSFSSCSNDSPSIVEPPDIHHIGPSVAPPAPAPSSPANGASVVVPFTISWGAAGDPATIVAYNWQLSSSATFSPIVRMGSTNGATQDVVSGLPAGTYFWRVQAVNSAFEQGPFSAAQTVVVTGAGPTTLPTPVLGPTQAYSTFHPREVIRFHWGAVAGAVTYRLEISNDANFPLGQVPAGVLTFWFDNIPDPNYSFMLGDDQGTFFARVYAVNADNPQGIRSLPSNVITYSVSYNNPIGPPPVLTFPPNGATLALPLTLTWNDVPNPQPSGYEVQISPNSSFTVNEAQLGVQLTNPQFNVLTLTAGTKFWRVRSSQGMASPTTVAVTAWSATGTFTISNAPPTPVSIQLAKSPLYSGEQTWVSVQLTSAVPAAGATIVLSSSNSAAAPVPATIAMPGNAALTQFQLTAGQVTVPTPVTLTATLNGGTATGQFTVLPPSLASLSMPSSFSGGALSGGNVMLNGQAPPGGALVTLSSNSPAATPPASVLVPAGSFSAPFTMPTASVSVSTPVTITASWNGTSVQAQMTLTPLPPPATLTLTPTSVVGLGGSSFARVTVATPAANDLIFPITSSNPSIASLNNSVTIPAGSTQGGFDIFTSSVSVSTPVTISVAGGGVTLTATLTVNPQGAPPPPPPVLAGVTVTPSSVTAGGSATGTVNLSVAAPSGGTTVSLSSGLPLRIIVPASVTVPAGASSATFAVTTTAGPATSTNICGTFAGVSSCAGFTVNATPPPPTPAAPTLISPSVDATVAQPVTFDWSDVPNAVAYEIQIDNTQTIAAPFVAAQIVAVSTATVTGLPAQRLWWRVRAQNSAGVFGPFSTTRRFTAQAAPPPPPPPPAPASLSTVSLTPSSVTGGSPSSGTITLTSAAPAGGIAVGLTSSNTGAATVPASVNVSAGATSASFAVTTASVATTTSVTITATQGTVTRTALLSVNPASQTVLPAPSLSSPAADARFTPGQSILFDWSDVAGAANYTIEIDDNSSITAPLTLSQTLAVSQLSTSTLPVQTMWFRVRANSASGSPGTWSAVRRFEVKN